MGSDMASLDALQKADPQQLAKFIHSEHPQTIASIVSHLNPSQAAALLMSLPADIRSDVALRMASLDQISPEIIGKIAGVIGKKLKALGELSRESYGGVRAVAEMLNRLDSGTSKEILDNIEQQDPNLAETIRHLMFVFEDLLLIDVNGIKEVLGQVDRKLLTVALKGTSEQLQNHFMQCMSQRGAEMLREDMDAMGPVKIKEVESAQQQIIAIVRQLESPGRDQPEGDGGRAVCRLRSLGLGRRRGASSRWCGAPAGRRRRARRRPSRRAAGPSRRRTLRNGTGPNGSRRPSGACAEARQARLAARAKRPGRRAAAADLRPVIERLARSIEELAVLRPAALAQAEARPAQTVAGHRAAHSAPRTLDRSRGRWRDWCGWRCEKVRVEEVGRVRVAPGARRRCCRRRSSKLPRRARDRGPGRPAAGTRRRGARDRARQSGRLVETQLAEIERGLTDRLRRRA